MKLPDPDYRDNPLLKPHFSRVNPYLGPNGYVENLDALIRDTFEELQKEQWQARWFFWWPPIAWRLVWAAHQERKRMEYMQRFLDQEFERIKKEKEKNEAA